MAESRSLSLPPPRRNKKAAASGDDLGNVNSQNGSAVKQERNYERLVDEKMKSAADQDRQEAKHGTLANRAGVSRTRRTRG